MQPPAIFERQRGDFLLSTDPARLDLDIIHEFLSKHSYWSQGIPRAVVAQSIQHSLPFGLYALTQADEQSDTNHQAGFARVVSDYTTFAWLADVFILEDYRGQGLGKWLIESVRAHPALQGLRRWQLITRDAHGLYAQFGFAPLSRPEGHMEIFRPNVYQRRDTPQAG